MLNNSDKIFISESISDVFTELTDICKTNFLISEDKGLLKDPNIDEHYIQIMKQLKTDTNSEYLHLTLIKHIEWWIEINQQQADLDSEMDYIIKHLPNIVRRLSLILKDYDIYPVKKILFINEVTGGTITLPIFKNFTKNQIITKEGARDGMKIFNVKSYQEINDNIKKDLTVAGYKISYQIYKKKKSYIDGWKKFFKSNVE